MFYVVNNHLNDLYVVSNKAVGPGKKSKINKRRAYVYSGLQSKSHSKPGIYFLQCLTNTFEFGRLKDSQNGFYFIIFRIKLKLYNCVRKILIEPSLDLIRSQNSYYFPSNMIKIQNGYFFKDQALWAKKSILNVAATGKFSSEHTIA